MFDENWAIDLIDILYVYIFVEFSAVGATPIEGAPSVQGCGSVQKRRCRRRAVLSWENVKEIALVVYQNTSKK